MLSNRLKQLRERRDISKTAMAQMLSLTQPGYSAYEFGLAIPPLPTLLKLADFYGVSLDYLVDRNPSQIKSDGEFDFRATLLAEIESLPPSHQNLLFDYFRLLKQDCEINFLSNLNKNRTADTNHTQPQIAACGGGIVPIDDEIAEDMRNFNEAIEGGAVGEAPEKNHKG